MEQLSFNINLIVILVGFTFEVYAASQKKNEIQ
jgi:hypothetical protein